MAKCILCGANATVNTQDNASRTIYNCHNCGVFVVSDLVTHQLKKHRCMLAAYFTNRKLAGFNDTVLISYDKAKRDKDYLQLTVEQLLEQSPKNFTALMDKVLQNLSHLSAYEGAEIKVESLESFPLFYVKQASYEAMSFVIKSMQKMELLEVNYYGNSFFPCGVIIAPKGWDRLARMQSNTAEEKTALLLCSGVVEERADIIQAAAKQAAKESGYCLAEVRTLHASDCVDHELIGLIKQNALLIGDLSNVSAALYYAVGMAQALGKTNVLTCHASEKEDLRVNPQQVSVLLWEDEKDLYLKTLNAIRALM